MNQSLKLAMLWTGLERVRAELDNDLLPLVGHLAIAEQDPALAAALEAASDAIASHQARFKLQAQPIAERSRKESNRAETDHA